MSMDAWENPNVRQPSILDQLDEFAQWFELEQRKHDDREGIPEDEREDVGLSATIAQARQNEITAKQEIEASGIKLTSLSKAKAIKAEEEEQKKFIFANLKDKNMEAWEHI